jgi:hypothetical protein
MRRGHWRTIRGKRIWVRPCEVGDKARGGVIHDYAVGRDPPDHSTPPCSRLEPIRNDPGDNRMDPA